MDNSTATSGETESQLDLLATELIWLLTNSGIDGKTQETLLEALPHLNLEEIIELLSTLEAQYTGAQTGSVDSATEVKLNQIAAAYTGRQQDRDAELVAKLEALHNSLD